MLLLMFPLLLLDILAAIYIMVHLRLNSAALVVHLPLRLANFHCCCMCYWLMQATLVWFCHFACLLYFLNLSRQYLSLPMDNYASFFVSWSLGVEGCEATWVMSQVG